MRPYYYYNNIERQTEHTTVSWHDPKQWMIIHTSDLMMIIRQSTCILSIITREMGKLKTHSSIYCIMDKWKNMLNLTHMTKCNHGMIDFTKCIEWEFLSFLYSQRIDYHYPRQVLAFRYCRCLRLSVCVSVCVCGNHMLVCMITHHPFELGSPNLDHRCKRPWLRSP